MHFKGQLLLPDEPGPGLRVDLDVAEHHLAVESDSGGLGAWPLEVVDVERLHSDVFVLTVAGEPLRFVAEDSVSFAYSGVPSIEGVSPRLKTRSALRSVLDWLWSGPDQPDNAIDTTAPSADDAGQDRFIGDVLSVRDEPGVPAPVMEDPAGVAEIEHQELFEPAIETVPENPADLSASLSSSLSPTADTAEPSRCMAIRSDGRRCESQILTSSGYCYPHDPKRAFEDRYEAAQEARAQLRRDGTERLNRIYGRLEKAMRQVERGDLDPEKAMAMAQLARTMCAILDMDEPETDDRR